MKVSVITVVKNDFKNIQKTINSVFNQNYKNIEHILIDGKSTDGTFEIIKKNKKKISLYNSQKDKNLYDAINKGIALSNGDVVGILHSGDIYTNYSVIKKSIRILKQKNLDFVLSNLIIINNKNKVFRYINTSNFFKPFMLSFGIQPPHPTLFIKKKVVQDVNYYSTKYKIVGDFDFFCKIFRKKTLKWKSLNYTSVILKRGGLSDGGLISKITMADDMLKILKKHNFISFKILFLFRFLLRLKELWIHKN